MTLFVSTLFAVFGTLFLLIGVTMWTVIILKTESINNAQVLSLLFYIHSCIVSLMCFFFFECRSFRRAPIPRYLWASSCRLVLPFGCSGLHSLHCFCPFSHTWSGKSLFWFHDRAQRVLKINHSNPVAVRTEDEPHFLHNERNKMNGFDLLAGRTEHTRGSGARGMLSLNYRRRLWNDGPYTC